MGNPKRIAYFVSDSTGITAEVYGRSLLSQFGDIQFDTLYRPHINTIEKAKRLAAHVNEQAELRDDLPMIFSTMADKQINECLEQTNSHYYELFDQFMPALIEATGLTPVRRSGRVHSIQQPESYDARIDTINYAMTNDDGTHMENYANADVILVGVSRSGKTPTCLYLALHFNLRAANYPITDDDFEKGCLPDVILDHKDKVFALTIDPQRLANIRERRRPLSRYAELKNCHRELALANDFYERYGFRVYDSTTHSIEELTSLIVTKLQDN